MFIDKLAARVKTLNTVLCAGLDPDPHFFSDITATYNHLIPKLAPYVAAIKPNIAFFEQHGILGLKTLAQTLELIRSAGVPIILDIKRGDIGSTAEAYAKAYLEPGDFEVDAITVNPFLGFDTLEPYLSRCKDRGKGIFVLVRTSNPGSGDLQALTTDKLTAWMDKNSKSFLGSCGFSSLGAVVGATHPSEAAQLRTKMPNCFFLIPGVGAQGGTAKDAVITFNAAGLGGVINVSRGLFPKDITDSDQIVLLAKQYRDQFNEALRANALIINSEAKAK